MVLKAAIKQVGVGFAVWGRRFRGDGIDPDSRWGRRVFRLRMPVLRTWVFSFLCAWMRTGECLDNCNGALSAKSLRFGRLVPLEHFPVRSIESIVDWDVFLGLPQMSEFRMIQGLHGPSL